MASSDSELISRISALVRRDSEGAMVRTLDPQVRTSKYGGLGDLRDASAQQDYGERQQTVPLEEVRNRATADGGAIDRSRLVRSFGDLSAINDQIDTITDYYSHPVFFAYERQTESITGETEFDLQPLLDVVTTTDHVLDVGYGTGRVLSYLQESGLGRLLDGVDSSPLAYAAARDRVADGSVPVNLRLGSIFDVLGPSEKFDVVMALDATINVFANASELSLLLAHLTQHLADNGRVVLSMFDDAAIPSVADRLNGLHVVHRFNDDRGEAQLLWWGMEFDLESAILHRCGFVDRSGSKQPHLLVNQFDRLWTPIRLEPLLSALGLNTIRSYPGEANGGALRGLPTVTLVVQKN